MDVSRMYYSRSRFTCVLNIYEHVPHLCWSIAAAHCMTCGRQARMNLQRGMSEMASVRLGLNPKCKF